MHPIFRTQIFEIDPHGLLLLDRHRFDIRLRQLASESFDDDGCGLYIRKFFAPHAHFHPAPLLAVQRGIRFRAQLGKTRQIVHPQPHSDTIMLVRQLARQPPAHADVAIVVDDVTKYIAAQRRSKITPHATLAPVLAVPTNRPA